MPLDSVDSVGKQELEAVCGAATDSCEICRGWTKDGAIAQIPHAKNSQQVVYILMAKATPQLTYVVYEQRLTVGDPLRYGETAVAAEHGAPGVMRT